MVDTRIWNIVPLALLLAGCPSDTIPVGEGETGDGDGDPATGDGDGDPATGDGDGDASTTTTSGDGDGDASTTTTGDGDGDSEDWCADDPCPEGWLCISYGSSGYCYPGCYDGDGLCSLGEACYGGGCQDLDPLPDCEGPAELTELPIPVAVDEVLDLGFADLDNDGDDELLALRPGELVVVEDLGAAATIPVDALADGLLAVHADDDGVLDVFLTSTQDNHAVLLLGNGDGTLAAPLPRTLPGMRGAEAPYWAGFGAGSFVAITEAEDLAFEVRDLDLETPNTTAIELGGFDPSGTRSVHPGDFDLAVFDEWSGLLIHDLGFGGESRARHTAPENGGLVYIKNFDFDGASNYEAHSLGFALGSDQPDSAYVYALQHGNFSADIHVYFNDPQNVDNAAKLTCPDIRGLAHEPDLGLVIATVDDTKLIEMDGVELGCMASENTLPASTHVAVGRFADNPGLEVALVDDQGQLRVWGAVDP